MISRRITAAPALLVSLAEFKDHARIEDESEDGAAALILRAAHDSIQVQTNIALTAQTFELILDVPFAEPIILPVWPVRSVTEITHETADSPPTVVDPGIYHVTATRPARIHLGYQQTWPDIERREGGLRIVYEAGHDEDAEGLESLRLAVLFLATHWFNHRDAVVVGLSVGGPMPLGLQGLIEQQRLII